MPNDTTNAPPAASISRLESSDVFVMVMPLPSAGRTTDRLRGPLHSFDDSGVRAAPTEVTVHLATNVLFARIRIAGQKLRALDRHSVVAIPALRGVLVNERLLQGMYFRRL